MGQPAPRITLELISVPFGEGMMVTGSEDQRAFEAVIIENVRDRLDHARRQLRDRDLPYVTLTYAQSIDGSISHSSPARLQLSNADSEKLTHQLRALHDVILVGINTVLIDDPRLNVRLVSGKAPQPVVVDTRLRFPLSANLLKAPCVRPIVVAGESASRDKERRLVEAGARVIRVALQEDGLMDLAQLLGQLKQSGFNSVMIEGGARIITSVITSCLADQFVLTISPKFVGGLHALNCRGLSEDDGMPRLRHIHYQWLTGNLIIQGELDPVCEAAGVRNSAGRRA